MVTDMITYEIQFKCYLPEVYVSRVPVIQYRYRRSGNVFWEKKDIVAIDHFALRYWKKEYYDEDQNKMAAYNRVRIMREILDKEYNGNLRKYVRAMVEFEIMSDLIDKEDYDTREISLSFVTDGWERTTVRLKRKECSNEKTD